MPITPTQALLAAALLAGVLIVLFVDGIERCQRLAADRLLYGVPWGSALTVAVVVGFYLVAQDGARHWGDPVVYPFVSWSLFYPTGLVSAGIAHAGPGHLLSNLTATLVFAPLAEYLWGHYPSREEATGSAGPTRLRPWIRALVVVPAALLGVSLITSLFSLGPGLGFSGTVFALVGFVVVMRPLWGVAGVVASSAVSVVFDALASPVVRGAVELGAPAPPGWAGVGFYAHLLGFLVGAILAVAVLSHRGRRLRFGRAASLPWARPRRCGCWSGRPAPTSSPSIGASDSRWSWGSRWSSPAQSPVAIVRFPVRSPASSGSRPAGCSPQSGS